MKKKTIIFILSIVIILSAFILGWSFRYQIMGYQKLGAVDNWSIYYKGETCATALELVYTDGESDYYLPCISNDQYVITNGIQVYHLKEALEAGIISIDAAREYIQMYVLAPNQ